MNRYKGILKIAVHYKICIRQPDFVVMVNRVKEFVSRSVAITQPRIEPLLLQQKLHFVFLKKINRKKRRLLVRMYFQFFVSYIPISFHFSCSRLYRDRPFDVLRKISSFKLIIQNIFFLFTKTDWKELSINKFRFSWIYKVFFYDFFQYLNDSIYEFSYIDNLFYSYRFFIKLYFPFFFFFFPLRYES